MSADEASTLKDVELAEVKNDEIPSSSKEEIVSDDTMCFCVLCGREHEKQAFDGGYYIESLMEQHQQQPEEELKSPNSDERCVSWEIINRLFGGSSESTSIEEMIQHHVETYYSDHHERLISNQTTTESIKLRICDRLFEFIDKFGGFMVMTHIQNQEVDNLLITTDEEGNHEALNYNAEEQQQFSTNPEDTTALAVHGSNLRDDSQIIDEENIIDMGGEDPATLDATNSELETDSEEMKEKKFMKLLNGFSDKLVGDISKEYFQKPSTKDFILDILKILLSFMLILCVILIGAMAIMFIEQDNELKIYEEYKKELLNSTSTEYTLNNSTDNGNVTFDPFNPKWTYGNSVYFMIVSLTTIGYGDLSPSTLGGKLWLVFFGFLGISLMGMWISFVGGAIMNSFGTGTFVIMLYIKRSIMVSFKTAKSMDIDEVMKIKSNMMNPELTPFEKRMYSFFNRGVTQIINMILLLGAYVVAAAALFSYLEGWSYQDAFYYSFVTLSTIGYGDFYPKTLEGKITFGVFSLVGLGLLGILLGFVGKSIQESVLSNFKKAQKKTFLELKDLQEKAAMKQIGNMMNKQKQNMTQGFNILKKGGMGGIHFMKAGAGGGFKKLKQGGNLLKDGGVGGLNILKQGGSGGLNKLKQGGNFLKEGGGVGLNKLKQGGNFIKEGGGIGLSKLKAVNILKKNDKSQGSQREATDDNVSNSEEQHE